MALLYLVTISLISGCSLFSALDKIVPDNTTEYRKAKTLPPLEIPPDLSADAIHDNVMDDVGGGTATYLEYQEQAHNPLMDIYGIKSNRKPRLEEGKGGQQRLVVPGNKKKVWERVHNFWLINGYKIKAEDIRIGFMDAIGPSEWDNYRVRMERGETPPSTVVYVKQNTESANPRREEAILRKLAEYLGALHAQDLARAEQSSQRATTIHSSHVNLLDGGTALQIAQDFSHAWRRVGLVLDRKGFTVDDRNRSQGIYYVRYDDPFTKPKKEDSGWLSKLAFWKSTTDKSEQSHYQIKLIPGSAATRVVILDKEGRRNKSETAKQLLSLLEEQLTE